MRSAFRTKPPANSDEIRCSQHLHVASEDNQYSLVVRLLHRAEFARSKNRKVRRHLLQFGAFLLLLVCLCGHIAETFDFWDHTLQKGNDIEYSLVVVALVAGAVFGLAAIVMRAASPTSCLLSSLTVSSRCALSPVAGTGYSPSPPLRI